METPDSQADPNFRLRRLFKEAGLQSSRVAPGCRTALFGGTYRDWTICARLNADWLSLSTIVCAMPTVDSLRSRLERWALETNAALSLAKFVVRPDGNLGLDVDYRAEHLDAKVLENLIGLMRAVAEERYPQVFRLASGDAVLQQLGTSLEANAA